MSDPSQILTELAEAEAAMTRTPWKLRYHSNHHSVRSLSVHQADRSGDDDLPIADVWLPMPWNGLGGEREDHGRARERRADADAAGIAEIRNHAHALIEIAQAAEQMDDEWDAWMSDETGDSDAPERAIAAIRAALAQLHDRAVGE